MKKLDVIIIGAGAAGLMCGIEAGKRGRRAIVLDHANKAGKKILMSGGGRCNFTNYHISPENYISHNPHFCKSALSRYTQWDFIEWVKKHHIPFHEKAHGQLFCDNKSQDILGMLLNECLKNNVEIILNTVVNQIDTLDNGQFIIKTHQGDYSCQSLVIATGGLSIPTMGASPFGYQIAKQFDIPVWPTSAGLVPFVMREEEKEKFALLSGISVDCTVKCGQQHFRENILFTHRGLSGPAILQISSYWKSGDDLLIHMLPGVNLEEICKLAKQESPQKLVKTILAEYLPKRLIEMLLDPSLTEMKLQSITAAEITRLVNQVQHWIVKPAGTEGYRTAEVTLGGVDCNALSSKTMEVNHVPGLYFIGELLDVTGWLGGYNFQWAWSSGWAAGQKV